MRHLQLSGSSGVPCLCQLLVLACLGCHRDVKTDTTRVSDPPTVRLIRPEVRTIVRVVGQPSFVEAYERTSIYPKMSAFIEKWYVDIGDKVKKGQVLADLFVPEIEEDSRTKKATVALDQQQVELAKKSVLVAKAEVKAAGAQLKAAKAIWGKFDAQSHPLELRGATFVARDKARRGRQASAAGITESAQVEHCSTRLR